MPIDPLVFSIVAGLFGLLLGSFLNVCIYRIPRDLSIVLPRSFCPHCNVPIAWYDNIPLLSYLSLRGRCRNCGAKIPLRYPAVELIAGILFALMAAQYGWSWHTAKWMMFESLLIALFWTDLETRLLPEEFTLGGALAGLAWAAFIGVPSGLGSFLLPDSRPVIQSLSNAALGATLLAAPIWLIGFVYARIRVGLFRILPGTPDVEFREVLGLGDVSLLILMGVFLGVEKGLLALLIGSVTGSVVGLGYIQLSRKNALEFELPFGSFLTLGAALIPVLTRLN